MALISKKPHFIYIHPFKCAGNSIRRALAKEVSGTEELHGVHVEALDIKTHYEAQDMLSFYENAFKFSFVRNPYDWMVSTYFYIRKSRIHQWHQLAHKLDFPQWLDWYVSEKFHSERPYGSNKFITMKEFVCDKNGDLIVDFIGKTETIQKDYNEVCKVLGIKSHEVQKVNVTIGNLRTADYRQYYDEKSKGLIEKHFGEDLDYFQYKW